MDWHSFGMGMCLGLAFGAVLMDWHSFGMGMCLGLAFGAVALFLQHRINRARMVLRWASEDMEPSDDG